MDPHLVAGRFRLPASGGAPWWSDELYRVLGMAPGDLPPTVDALMRHVRVVEREALGAALEACASEGRPYSHVHTIKDLEGQPRVVAIAAVATAPDAGAGHDVDGVVVDVSPVVAARAARAVNEQLPPALAGRAPVEQAVGCLGVVYGVDRSTALEMLRWSARQRQAPLPEVAALVMAAVERLGGDLGADGEALEELVTAAIERPHD